MPRSYPREYVEDRRRRWERGRLLRDGVHLGFIIALCFFGLMYEPKAALATLIVWLIYAAWDVGLL